MGESSALRRHSRLNRSLVEARSAYEALEKSAAGATAKAAALREDAKTADEKAALTAERYRAHCQFLLAEKAARDRERPITELIDRALRLRIPA